MKKSLLSLNVLTLLLVCSCSNELEDIQNSSNEFHEIFEIAQAGNTPKALKNIQNYIKNGKFKGADTRSMKDISIEPYVIDGDTAMYIANYTNGWELFSTDQRTPLIMASSETGSFDVNNEDFPPALKASVFSIANEIHQLKQIENDDNFVNQEWMIYPEEMSELSIAEVASTNAQDEPGVGHWELIYSTKLSEGPTTQSAKYTVTKWHQSSPFNQYVPYSLNTSGSYVPSKAGCVPVATAQYLYFLHSKYGKPEKAVSTAMLSNATTHKYAFSNKTTRVWSQMALTKTESSSKTAKSAMLIAYVGQKMNTVYTPDSATVSMAKAAPLIKSETGINHTCVVYDYSFVINQLLNKHEPVMVCAMDYNLWTGHTFIIDRILSKEVTYKDYYGWVGTTSTGENANYIDESNGHIIGYKIKKEEVRTTTEYSYKMNWGWHDSTYNFDDNIVFRPYSIDDWHTNTNPDYHYNYGRYMLKINN